MNIDDMTYGEIKELVAIFAGPTGQTNTNDIGQSFRGRYVLVRCRDAGVHAGECVGIEGRSVVLKKSRRLWTWKPTQKATLSAVSIYGINQTSSKVGAEESEKLLTETCEITICSKEAEDSIRSAPEAS